MSSRRNKLRKRIAKACNRLLALHPDACPFCHGKGFIITRGFINGSRLPCEPCKSTGSRAKAMELLLTQ